MPFGQGGELVLDLATGFQRWADKDAHPATFSTQGLGQSLRHGLPKACLLMRFHLVVDHTLKTGRHQVKAWTGRR